MLLDRLHFTFVLLQDNSGGGAIVGVVIVRRDACVIEA